MKSWRWLTVATAVVVLTAACGTDVEPTTTTAAEATDTTTGETTNTTAVVSPAPTTNTPPEDDRQDLLVAGPCYLENVIAVETEQGDTTALLQALGFEPTKITSTVILDLSTDPSPEVEDEPLAVLDEALDFFLINGNPLEAALALFEEDITAAPIHAMGQAGHWKYGPGTTPVELPGSHLVDVAPASKDEWVGVVDSGVVATGPNWLYDNLKFDSPFDVETLVHDEEASHGTFVSGLIRQLAPEFKVSTTKARSVPLDYFVAEDKPAGSVSLPDVIADPTLDPVLSSVQHLTTELHVAEAIGRLIDRGHKSMPALNLSLGAYECEPTEDIVFLTLIKALDLWFAAYGEAPIYAAAGNELDPRPFWPAALSQVDGRIHGVAAANLDGDEVVWDQAGDADTSLSRNWVTDFAPGTDLVSTGRSATEYAWSGSSFASAAATAMFVRGDTASEPVAGKVSGLTFVSKKEQGSWTLETS